MVERINLLLKAKNVTARQFAEEIGIQPSGMSHIMSGRNNPSLDFVMKVVKRWPEVNINWLMLGKGEMYASVPLNASGQEHHDVEPVVERQPAEQYDLFAQPATPAQPMPRNEPKAVVEPVQKCEPVQAVSAARETVERQQVDEPLLPAVQQAPVGEVTRSAKAQLTENGVEVSQPVPEEVQLKQKRKKVVKMIEVYDDNSFAEYYPE